MRSYDNKNKQIHKTTYNNFYHEVKSFLKIEYNIDIKEEIIWAIIQLYKNKRLQTGKERKKLTLLNNFNYFTQHRSTNEGLALPNKKQQDQHIQKHQEALTKTQQ